MRPVVVHQPAWRNSSLRLYLYQIRKKQDISQESLAHESGYSAPTIVAWERGYRAPDTVSLINWVEALGYRLCVVPLDYNRSKKLEDVPEVREQMELALQVTDGEA